MKRTMAKHGRALLAGAIVTAGGLLACAATFALPADAEHECAGDATGSEGDAGSGDEPAPAAEPGDADSPDF